MVKGVSAQDDQLLMQICINLSAFEMLQREGVTSRAKVADCGLDSRKRVNRYGENECHT